MSSVQRGDGYRHFVNIFFLRGTIVVTSSLDMEEELKCPVCRRLFTNPVTLPCSHTLCLACALSVQNPASHFHSGTAPDVGEGPSTNNLSEFADYPDVDKVSVVSETDSGVVCNSRPNSYVGTPNVGSWLFHTSLGNAFGICCPACRRVSLLDEHGANGLPKNRVLEGIVDRYVEGKRFTVRCQMCEGDTDTNIATQVCEQCEVYYCDTCRDNCHPMRGPLAKHNVVPTAEGKALIRAKHKSHGSCCPEHEDESPNLFCALCKAAICYICVQDGRHTNHEVQPLNTICKSQKVSCV